MGSEEGASILLTKPLSFDNHIANDDYKAPNLLQRLLSLFKNVRPGSNLTQFQLPPLFNTPKSQLQCFGESVYAMRRNLLHKCNNEDNSLERFKSVVAWSISTARPAIFGVAPYNPILGETHHVSNETLNVLLEQVSHHPPVSALHATDEEESIEMVWCQHPLPKFYGTRVEVEVRGERQLKLLKHGETYIMNSPTLLIKFFPPGVDWIGNVSICCKETDLEAELCFVSNSFLRRRRPHSVKGRIYESTTGKTLFEVDGHWDSTITLKDIHNGKANVIYDAKEALSELKTPVVKDAQGVWRSESVRVWSEVSKGIISKNWDKAREAKKEVEEKQRELMRDMSSRGETWSPKHFTVSRNKNGDWDCSPILKSVPPAPVIIPI